MNPSSPTFLSKPSIHDQLRNMSAKINNNEAPEKKEVFDLRDTSNRYLTRKATPETVKIEMRKVESSADDFLAALHSEEESPRVSAESAEDINNALDFYNKRKESAPLRQNIVKVGSEMRPRSRQIEEDLKSLEAKNQKTEEGQVLALEAKVRLMREVVDSENIIEKNRAEIKRLRNELNATSLDKKSLQEKLDQAGKDLDAYEKEIKKTSRALEEVEKNNSVSGDTNTITSAVTSTKPIRVDGGLAGLANVSINIVNHSGLAPVDAKKKKPKSELRSEIKKGSEYEIVKIPKNADHAGFISNEEAEGIRNKLVSDLKVKLLEFKSVEEIDYYVALEQDKLKDEIQNIGLDTDAGYRFYHDMLDGRIRNSDGRLGASFNFLKNIKREELIKGNLNTKKKEGKVFTTTKAGKKMPIDVDDAYMDWKYSKQNDVSEEIANYNRKKNVGFSPDKSPVNKIEAEVEQSPTPTIPDAPVIGVSAEDITSISKPKSPRATKSKTESNVWGSTVRGLEDSGLRNRINSERDEREDVLKQEAERLLSDERLRLDEEINALRASFEAEMNRKNEAIRKRDEDLMRIQAALEAEKNKNVATAPINQPAPKAPPVIDVAPKIKHIDLDEIIEKLKLKKDPKPVTNNVNATPAPTPTTNIYTRPNINRIEAKTGKVGLRSVFLTAIFAGLMSAGGGYIYGQNVGVEKTTQTLTSDFNAQKIKDIEDGAKKTQEVIIDSYNKGYEKSKIDATENLLTKEATPEETRTTEPTKAEEKTTTKAEQKAEQKSVSPKPETKTEAKPQQPEKKLEWTNKASASPRPEVQSLNVEPAKSSVDFSSLAGADNKSVEVKRTEKGTVYKLADYGIEGANKDGIEYIANPVSKSVERRNNFCNLKSVESKAFLGFNSLQDAATACLHQLWRYQSGNNKVGLSGDSTLEQMIGKYANLKKEINEDDFESYLKIIQKTYKDYGLKVNQDTKLANLDMSKMLEAISIAENKFYAFDAKSMTINLKSGVKQGVLFSAGNIMNEGPESERVTYNTNSYGGTKYRFEYNPFIIKNT